MKTKIVLVVGIAAVVAAVVIEKNQSRPKAPVTAPPPAPVLSAPVKQTVETPSPEVATQPAPVVNAEAQPPVKTTYRQNTTTDDQPLVINGYTVQDPLARAALSYVGADQEATAYWVGAINDPTLPSEERKDLIEDLNEDGLSDPKNPGPQDMPLIAARLQLIESLERTPMDPVNARALAEAKKDMISMINGETQH